MTNTSTDAHIKILGVAQEIDGHITRILARILDVDVKTSIVLGNSADALTFPTRVFMLIDLLSMSAKKRAMFEHFLALWRSVALTEHSASFIQLYSAIPAGEKYILRSFPQDTQLPIEHQLSNAVELLCNKLKDESSRAMDILRNQQREEILGAALNEVQEMASTAIEDVFRARYKELDERMELGMVNMPVKNVRSMLAVILLTAKGKLREFVDSATNAERYPTTE